MFGHEVFEHLFGDVGLEDPLGAELAVDRRCALPAVAVLVARGCQFQAAGSW
ncbi:MAG: hypothetical protein R3C10_07280 [Pirellulales bacterium]